ncbi:hypothetical protein KIN20_008238 [Parelaphostrongylus tenuis]|uniref:Uncharacterized protein n=1 Tax=Parelaphostrongylus tenuis TaxID=148309 RepID=A0AAD5MQ70_PARTN|nr:hypothetical protein KIN20_008238 [Parelaphostrongylus tenuis]
MLLIRPDKSKTSLVPIHRLRMDGSVSRGRQIKRLSLCATQSTSYGEHREAEFYRVKKKVAFTSIEKGECEKVANILISAEVNPEEEVFERSEEEVVSVVRRQLCPSLKALLEHGMLKETLTQRSLPSSLGLGCFVTRNGTNSMLKLL